jgi:hypothetical protein
MENKYFKEEDQWYMFDKNGTKRKVTSENKIQELEGSIDLTAEAASDEPQLESSGLGDTIKKITNKLGLKTCEPCNERKKTLNRWFPYLNINNVELLNDEEQELLDKVLSHPIVSRENANKIFDLYNNRFNHKKKLKYCTCPGVFRTLLERLQLLSNK